MLEFYRVEYSIKDLKTNRKLVNWFAWHDICTDEELESKVQCLSWDNIKDVDIHQCLNPKIKERKKGQVFEFHEYLNEICYSYKQWKRPILDLEYRVSYIPVVKSIRDILKFSDGALAIRYLLERGINAQLIINENNV